MTRSVVTCSSDTTIEEALRLMEERRIRHLPVTENGELVGILSIRELSWVGTTDIASIFHWLFVCYCKVLGQILKSGAASFTPYFIEELIELYERRGFRPAEHKPTRILTGLKEMLKKAKMVEDIYVKEIEEDRYLLEFQNCVFASEAHPFIKGSDLICPLSIIAAALLRKATKRNVRLSFSTIDGLNSKTYITLKNTSK